MKFEDFMVGDILSCVSWKEATYRIIDINEDTKAIYLQSMEAPTANPFWWRHYYRYSSINIERESNFVNKTPIERKIAHLYKLFEERNKSCLDAA